MDKDVVFGFNLYHALDERAGFPLQSLPLCKTRLPPQFLIQNAVDFPN